MTWSIDRVALKIAVVLKRTHDRASMREAAQRARVAPKTIFNAENEKPMTAENLLAVVKWLGVDPFTFLTQDPDVSRDVSRGTGGETAQKQGSR